MHNVSMDVFIQDFNLYECLSESVYLGVSDCLQLIELNQHFNHYLPPVINSK